MSSAASDRDAEVYFRGEPHHPVAPTEPRLRDVGDFIPPTFFNFHCKQTTYLIRPLRDPWVALASRLGHPWVTLG